MTSGSAPGKVILTGEHAVVYKRPAIAIPVRSVRATASLSPSGEGDCGQIRVTAPEIMLNAWLHEIPEGQPLREALQWLQQRLLPADHPPLQLTLDSSIPPTGGLGSSAAIASSVLQAMAAYASLSLSREERLQITFQTETVFHGTPSGIDNTVITLNQPIFFERDRPPRPIKVHSPFQLLIADTGKISQTAVAVARVRQLREQNPGHCDTLFDQIAEISRHARASIERGDLLELGRCFNDNQLHLQALRVSSVELDALVHAARQAGALGAKLSGGGMGGNMIALVTPESTQPVLQGLEKIGATRIIHTEVRA